ncbi:protein of unknown function [Burkholderia multivorans]
MASMTMFAFPLKRSGYPLADGNGTP